MIIEILTIAHNNTGMLSFIRRMFLRNGECKTITSVMVGLKFRNPDDIAYYELMKALELPMDVELKHEYTNVHDKKAIAVSINGCRIGYIPRCQTAKIHNIKGGVRKAQLKPNKKSPGHPFVKITYVPSSWL